MRRRADDAGVDLLLVDTGDRVEGNGLYDASTPKGQYTYDIFKQQDIDIICSGNHELYQADTADREHQLTVPNFAGHYLASNLDYIDPATGNQVPMAEQRYRAFQTKHQKLDVVAFGFLFNFTGNAANSVVQPVQQTIQEPWFQYAISKEPADLFVVIGHVGARMGELRAIYQAIRAVNPDTPIAIFAGHAHVRDAVHFDNKAMAIASGRYFETIGWMSVSGIEHGEASKTMQPAAPVKFARRYIDNNLLGLYYHSGTNATTFPTDHGLNVTATIAAARSDLDLETPYGCAPQNYWLQRRPHDDPSSVFTLLRKHVLPEAIVRADRADVPRMVIVNTGAMRFDIFRGAFTRDTTYIVSPFISLVHYIPDVPYALARQVLAILNSQGPILSAMAAAEEATAMSAGSHNRAVDWREMGVPEQYSMREEDSSRTSKQFGVDGAAHQKPLFGRKAAAVDGSSIDNMARPPLVAGYTTWDDFGLDGDDAIHEPLPHFRLPNCIQAEVNFPAAGAADTETSASAMGEPETVDLVFFDFIQRFVLMALAYIERSGSAAAPDGSAPYKHYTDADVETYLEGKFTDHFAEWVKQNWKDECKAQAGLSPFL